MLKCAFTVGWITSWAELWNYAHRLWKWPWGVSSQPLPGQSFLGFVLGSRHYIGVTSWARQGEGVGLTITHQLLSSKVAWCVLADKAQFLNPILPFKVGPTWPRPLLPPTPIRIFGALFFVCVCISLPRPDVSGEPVSRHYGDCDPALHSFQQQGAGCIICQPSRGITNSLIKCGGFRFHRRNPSYFYKIWACRIERIEKHLRTVRWMTC